jgi:hypothetical protein
VSGLPLLPAGLEDAVETVPAPQTVRVAGGPAYRYPDMRLRSSGLRLSAYVLPTTKGADVVACHAPADTDAFDRACERAAGTLRATSGKVLPLGPSQAYADGLSAAMRRLDRTRVPAREALKRSSGYRAQATQARRLETAFANARARVGRLTPPAGTEASHRRVRKALGEASQAYTRLRQAALDKAKPRFDAARTRVEGAEAGVRTALRGLGDLGYDTRA